MTLLSGFSFLFGFLSHDDSRAEGKILWKSKKEVKKRQVEEKTKNSRVHGSLNVSKTPSI